MKTWADATWRRACLGVMVKFGSAGERSGGVGKDGGGSAAMGGGACHIKACTAVIFLGLLALMTMITVLFRLCGCSVG